MGLSDTEAKKVNLHVANRNIPDDVERELTEEVKM